MTQIIYWSVMFIIPYNHLFVSFSIVRFFPSIFTEGLTHVQHDNTCYSILRTIYHNYTFAFNPSSTKVWDLKLIYPLENNSLLCNINHLVCLALLVRLPEISSKMSPNKIWYRYINPLKTSQKIRSQRIRTCLLEASFLWSVYTILDCYVI